MLTVYPACFYKEFNGSYTAIFPDLDHLSAQDKSLAATLAKAGDFLARYLILAKEENRTIDPPSAISEIDPFEEFTDCKTVYVIPVAVDVEEYARKHLDNSDFKE